MAFTWLSRSLYNTSSFSCFFILNPNLSQQQEKLSATVPQPVRAAENVRSNISQFTGQTIPKLRPFKSEWTVSEMRNRPRNGQFNISSTVLMNVGDRGSIPRLGDDFFPSVLWRCWLGGRKGIRPVKKLSGGCWRGYLSGARCRLALSQLIPLPLTVSCSSKSRLVLPIWYRLTQVVLEKRPLNGCSSSW